MAAKKTTKANTSNAKAASKKVRASKPVNEVKVKSKTPTKPKTPATAKPKTVADKAKSAAKTSKEYTASPKPKTVTQPMEDIMTKSTSQIDKAIQDAQATGKESFDALAKSYSIFVKGCESIARTSIEICQTTAEKQATYAKEAMSCKTINEFADVQNKIAQTNFDDFMSSITKISEISSKVLTESAEPINDQVGKVAKKVSDAA